jgi:hypothetical protein
MVRRWNTNSKKYLKADLPKSFEWTEAYQQQQNKMFAGMELDQLDPSLRGSPYGRPLYGRSPEEILLLALIAGNSQKARSSDTVEVSQICNAWQETLEKTMLLLFGRARPREDDSEIIYEIVSEIHRRELKQHVEASIPKRGEGSASERAVTKEVLLRRTPHFADAPEELETRIETVRKKIRMHYDAYVEHIMENNTYSEGEIYLVLRDIQELLMRLGIKMDLEALYASDVP